LENFRALHKFENSGIGHATTFAHCLQTVLDVVSTHVMEHGSHEARTGCTEWVAKGDRAAIWVG
jgi:hypothetical protein